jgi:hypothetical protein
MAGTKTSMNCLRLNGFDVKTGSSYREVPKENQMECVKLSDTAI